MELAIYRLFPYLHLHIESLANKRYFYGSINVVKKAYDKAMQKTGGITCHTEYIVPRVEEIETEYCAFLYFNNSLIYIGVVTGDSWYFDAIETFNDVQSARKKDESRF